MATLLKIRGLQRATSTSDVSATTGSSSMAMSKGGRGFRVRWGLGNQVRGTGQVQAAKTIGAANAAVTATANWPGVIGNSIQFGIVVAGGSVARSIVTTIQAATGQPIITVNPATTTGVVNGTETATAIAAAINNDPTASQYVTATAGGTGGSVVVAGAAANLTGGTDGAGTAEPIYLSVNSAAPVVVDIDNQQTVRSLRRNSGQFVSLGQP